MIITAGQVYENEGVRFKIIDVLGDMVKYIGKHYTKADWGDKVQYISVRELTEIIKMGTVKLIGSNFIKGCHHEFKSYTGLIETYNYCIHCDIKESKAV